MKEKYNHYINLILSGKYRTLSEISLEGVSKTKNEPIHFHFLLISLILQSKYTEAVSTLNEYSHDTESTISSMRKIILNAKNINKPVHETLCCIAALLSDNKKTEESDYYLKTCETIQPANETALLGLSMNAFISGSYQKGVRYLRQSAKEFNLKNN